MRSEQINNKLKEVFTIPAGETPIVVYFDVSGMNSEAHLHIHLNKSDTGDEYEKTSENIQR